MITIIRSKQLIYFTGIINFQMYTTFECTRGWNSIFPDQRIFPPSFLSRFRFSVALTWEINSNKCGILSWDSKQVRMFPWCALYKFFFSAKSKQICFFFLIWYVPQIQSAGILSTNLIEDILWHYGISVKTFFYPRR